MAKKKPQQDPLFVCARCGKEKAKYYEYFDEYLCRECAEKVKADDYEKINHSNGKLL
jgi:transcription initiation factor IIE alpha subunit